MKLIRTPRLMFWSGWISESRRIARMTAAKLQYGREDCPQLKWYEDQGDVAGFQHAEQNSTTAVRAIYSSYAPTLDGDINYKSKIEDSMSTVMAHEQGKRNQALVLSVFSALWLNKLKDQLRNCSTFPAVRPCHTDQDMNISCSL